MTKPPKDQSPYKVGYGRPPEHTRWKPGESGNPKGPPKRRNDPLKLVQKILSRTVTLNDGRSLRKVTVLEATLLSVSAKAAKGDLKAAQLVLGLNDAARALDPAMDVEFGADDLAILQEYATQLRREEAATTTESEPRPAAPESREGRGE